MNIAIIGAGIAGATVLRQLIQDPRLGSDAHIRIYEKRPSFGTGYPFQPDVPTSLLNSDPDEMSILPEDPEDFVRWLAAQTPEIRTRAWMPSRMLYGRYLTERFTELLADPRVTPVPGTVDGLTLTPPDTDSPTRYTLDVDGAPDPTVFDAVFACLGHPTYEDYYDLRGTDGFIHTPYPIGERLAAIRPETRVAILGAGPTAVDIIRYLSLTLPEPPPMTLYVPTADLQMTRVRMAEDAPYPFTWTPDVIDGLYGPDGLIPLEGILRRMAEDFGQAGVVPFAVYDRYRAQDFDAQRRALDTRDPDLAYLERYFDDLAAVYPTLYGALSPADRRRYTAEYEPVFEFFRGFTPETTMFHLLGLEADGRLTLVDGLDTVTHREGIFTLRTTDGTAHTADCVVNAAGFNTRLADGRAHDPLLAALDAQGALLPDADGAHILVNWPDCCLLNKRWGRLDTFMVQGMWIGGTHYHTNSVLSITAVGAATVNRFLTRTVGPDPESERRHLIPQ